MSDTLPSFAPMVLVFVIFANVVAVLVIIRTYMVNRGNVYDEGPPWIVAVSVVLLMLCYKSIILPAELSFWLATATGFLALWGAWVDYAHLSDHQRSQQEARAKSKIRSEKL